MQPAKHLFFTSDQLAFFDEPTAKRHAKTLPDASVIKMDNHSISAMVDSILPFDYDEADDLAA